MSRVDDVVARLCPCGVRFAPLGRVAAYSDTRIDASHLDKNCFVGVDNLLPNQAGKTDANYLPNTTRLTAYVVGDVLIGNIRPYLKKVWLANNDGGCSGDVLAIRIKRESREEVTPEFLYYLLSTESFFAYDMQHAKGAKMPRGSKAAILSYQIPVPPLAVQREIVNVLDTFTELEAKLEADLEAELEARQQQYQYYRDELLSLNQAKIGSTTLADVAINLDSRRRPVTKAARKPGDIPYYGASGVVDYVSDHIFDGDYLLISEDGANLLARSTPIAFSISGKAWVNNHAHVLQFKSYAERRFVENYLNSIDLAPFISGAAQPKLNRANLNRIPIPAYPFEEQARIVDIVDKFDALVSELSVGLSAELKSRRQQYQYYRDRLLTFREAA